MCVVVLVYAALRRFLMGEKSQEEQVMNGKDKEPIEVVGSGSRFHQQPSTHLFEQETKREE